MCVRSTTKLVLAVVLTAASCGSPTAVLSPIETSGAPAGNQERSDPPAIDDSLGGFEPSPVAWETCPRASTAQCGEIAVPLDWDDPDGPTIDLAVAMSPARGDRVGALLLNPGGPGAEGRSMAFRSPVGDDVAERFDMVGFDPRGVGESDGLECGRGVDRFLSIDSSPDDLEEQAELEQAAEDVASECATTDADLVANMGTDSVAKDVEAIRRALGGEPLNYIGFSYGSLIGLRYLDLFGSNVRTMVLDGVVDPTLPLTEWLAGQARALETAIDSIFESCDSSARCPLDDAARSYDELAASVEDQPLDSNSAVGPSALGPSELATAAIMATYAPQLRTPLIEAVADAEGGDPDPLLRLTSQYYSFGGFTSYVSVVCSDSDHPRGAEQWRSFADDLADISPRFGPSVANELLPCAFWSAEPDPTTGVVTAPDAPAVLVLGNRGDAATPYENSIAVADMLDTGVLVSYDGDGHTSYGASRCVDDVVDLYLIEGTAPDADPDC